MAERPLTFRERTGLVPMPRQLRTDELTPEIRAQLWAIVYGWMNRNSSYDFLEDDAKRFATQWFVEGMHRPIDEIVPHLDTIRRDLEPLFFARDFYPLFGTPLQTAAMGSYLPAGIAASSLAVMGVSALGRKRT